MTTPPTHSNLAMLLSTCFLLLTFPLAIQAEMTCIPPQSSNPFLQFCSSINYDVNGPTPDSVHYIDGLAKQTYVSALHMHAACGGKVLSKKCQIAFRKYSCAFHFPKCITATPDKEVHLKQPCREVCEHYCSTCNMAGCPCYDLPVKAAEGKESTCTTLEEYVLFFLLYYSRREVDTPKSDSFFFFLFFLYYLIFCCLLPLSSCADCVQAVLVILLIPLKRVCALLQHKQLGNVLGIRST